MRGNLASRLVNGSEQAGYVFSVAMLYPISLTPRFCEVHGRVCYHNRF
jgi:hypothetical protein